MNNKEATKDWTGNSVSYASTGGFSNYSTHEREQHDYYATDPRAVELLLDILPLSNIWECASGGGHLADLIESRGLLGRKSDIIDRTGDTEVLDFLSQSHKWDGDILTNPPYKYAEEFIRTALDAVPEGRKVCMFLPVRYLSSKRRGALYSQHPPRYVFVARQRIVCAINGRFDTVKSSAVDYCWIVWQKGYNGITELKWFN